ncbi:excisionase family DNA-binding protein [Bacillus sp. B1-b2]|uniref:excisionase family DNA-binding protein n=1 Tax=Bacillus sp. B1-b2 TaxID=2653201 RepID=UPI00126266B0|nr:excisionase family DNA-binding protein [Bacillus sp. B1-b2]KAB7672476.1 helix-turn-helix domain-containing protein [Bacillus sp. B1-b2]
MYLTVQEVADLLSISEKKVEKLIYQNQIRALYDGNGYLINKEQFQTHFKQMEKYKKYVEEVWNEPIPEDKDIKDED